MHKKLINKRFEDMTAQEKLVLSILANEMRGVIKIGIAIRRFSQMAKALNKAPAVKPTVNRRDGV